MSAVIIPIRAGKRARRIEHMQMMLSRTAIELWSHRPHLDLSIAIPAGYRALERGESIFEALEVVEGVLDVMVVASLGAGYREHVLRVRNIDRLTQYRIKLTNRR